MPTAPQISYRNQTGKFTVMRPPPKLENLVLRGGGGKGIGNAPALIELQEAKQLDGLKHVVGSSAGALTALCLASGNDAHDFQKIADNTSMTSLLFSPKDFSKRYPSVSFARAGANGGNAVEVADQNTAGKVSEYIQDQMKNHRGEFERKLRELAEAEERRSPGAGDKVMARIIKLQNQDFTKDRTEQMVTFNDLRLLSQLEPSKFRELTLTGWDAGGKKGTYFNATNSPDMPIAIAGRISMAIPPAFAQVKFDPGDGKGKRFFADGGIGSNLPSEAVTRTNVDDPSSELTGSQRQAVLMRSAVMTFDDGGSQAQAPKPGLLARIKAKLTGREPELKPELKGGYLAMHGSDEQNKKKEANWIKRKFSGNEEIHITSQRDQQKIQEFGLNAFVVGHDGMGTFGFIGATKGKIARAEESGAQMMKEQLSLREGQMAEMEYDTLDEAFNDLSPQEKQDLLKQPPPDASQFKEGVNDPNYKAEMLLRDKVAKESTANQQGQVKQLDHTVEEHHTSVRESMGMGTEGPVIGRSRSMTVTGAETVEKEEPEKVGVKIGRNRANSVGEKPSPKLHL